MDFVVESKKLYEEAISRKSIKTKTEAELERSRITTEIDKLYNAFTKSPEDADLFLSSLLSNPLTPPAIRTSILKTRFELLEADKSVLDRKLLLAIATDKVLVRRFNKLWENPQWTQKKAYFFWDNAYSVFKKLILQSKSMELATLQKIVSEVPEASLFVTASANPHVTPEILANFWEHRKSATLDSYNFGRLVDRLAAHPKTPAYVLDEIVKAYSDPTYALAVAANPNTTNETLRYLVHNDSDEGYIDNFIIKSAIEHTNLGLNKVIEIASLLESNNEEEDVQIKAIRTYLMENHPHEVAQWFTDRESNTFDYTAVPIALLDRLIGWDWTMSGLLAK